MSTTKRPKGAPGDISINSGKPMEHEGLPYKGKAFDLKENDPENKQPRMVMEAHVKVFNLADEEDVKKYEEIVQLLVSDKAILSYEEKQYDESVKGWRLLIVYSEVYYTTPPDLEE